MADIQSLHNEAVSTAKEFRKMERHLIEILMEIDSLRGFVVLGYQSMHVYCTKALGLSDAQAYSLVLVARKSREFPEIKLLVDSEKLNMANATQISRVIDRDNKVELLELGQSLSKRELEYEIKKICPEQLPKERVRAISENQSEMRLVVPKELEEALRRLQDLYSKRSKRSLSLTETLGVMAGELIKLHDPVKKAQRFLDNKVLTQRVLNHSLLDNKILHQRILDPKVPQAILRSEFVPVHRRRTRKDVLHQVNMRDRAQCTYCYPSGERCTDRRFLQVHHRVPVSRGGSDSIENLQTLCSNHHRFQHLSMPNVLIKRMEEGERKIRKTPRVFGGAQD